ncbi:LytR family transcriptional regulator [Clostridium polyendosporum]|uniref:LytR family transcriptional regulator n=1 Tax=Clostridium polyendosporum TaxID=69208 RepID=A0A919S075_9CLOT|nr:LCP family protein [Clostridium polyendosporum]GIM29469.1 LytR family transcriptional regulator [Clostridium polyendosporum]
MKEIQEHSNKSENKNKNKKVKIVLFSISCIILFILGFGGVYVFNTLNKVNRTQISTSDNDLGIDSSVAERFKDKENDIINIAFFGIDKREDGERGNSDSTMILTIDKITKKIKMTSIMKDSYVTIDGHDKDKLTNAFALGGPQLAIKTLNQNYGLNIKDFVAVNFGELAKIIDELGGIDINIKSYEIKELNSYIDDVNSVTNQSAGHISKRGLHTLSGIQAVAYSRIRYSGNGDIERTERQRTVLNAILDKIKNAGITKYPSMVNSLLPYVETSLSSVSLTKIGTDALSAGVTTITEERFPTTGYYNATTANDASYLIKFDEDVTKSQIQNYIFEDIKPTAKTSKSN